MRVSDLISGFVTGVMAAAFALTMHWFLEHKPLLDACVQQHDTTECEIIAVPKQQEGTEQ